MATLCKKIANGEKGEYSLIVAYDGFNPSELPPLLSGRQCVNAGVKTFYLDLDEKLDRLLRPNNIIFETSQSIQSRPKVNLTKKHVHKYITREVPATCFEKGYTLHKCDCGDEYKDNYKDYAPHDYKLSKHIEPSCTEKGYVRENCSVCGHERITEIPPLGHKFGEWIIEKRATCIENGLEAKTCERCGEKETRDISATGHDFSEWKISHSDPDKEERFCKNCGQVETRTGQAPIDLFNQGMVAWNKGDYENAKELIRLSAEKGYAEAQNKYGLIFGEGYLGQQKDIDEAIKWYKKAAEQNFSYAQYNLGVMYHDYKKDAEQALIWYKKAAEQGHKEAQQAIENIGKKKKDKKVKIKVITYIIVVALL